MNPQELLDVIRGLLYATVELSAPLLLVSLGVGVVVSIFQAATQINESTLTFLPKAIALLLTLMLMAPWMLRKMTDYTHRLYDRIPMLVRTQAGVGP